jgi:hypothetical protein
MTGIFEKVENAVEADARPVEGGKIHVASHSYILV